MKIIVYFEGSGHAEQVAEFYDEALYIACLPALQKQAKACHLFVTESVDD